MSMPRGNILDMWTWSLQLFGEFPGWPLKLLGRNEYALRGTNDNGSMYWQQNPLFNLLCLSPMLSWRWISWAVYLWYVWCSTSGDPLYENFTCPISTCCQNQSDEEGMLSCFDGTYPGYGYGSNYTFNAPYEEYTDCKATNSTPWCACNILAPSFCAEFENYFCDIQTCCQSQTDDAGRVDCVRNVIYDECISSGSNSTFCLCESSSISCLLEEDQEACEVNECCFSVDDYDGMKDCLGLGNDTFWLIFFKCNHHHSRGPQIDHWQLDRYSELKLYGM